MVSAFKLLLLLLSIFGYSKSRPPTPSDLQDTVNIVQEIEYFDDILPSYYNYNSTKLQVSPIRIISFRGSSSSLGNIIDREEEIPANSVGTDEETEEALIV